MILNEYSDGMGKMVFDGPVTSIGKAAFMDCVKITSMQIPESVTTIGNSAFFECRKLKTINIPKNLTSIGNSAFSKCSSLMIEVIPSSVQTIEKSAFSYCESIQKLVFDYGVVSIGELAFSCCFGLKELVLPNSVTTIGLCAFEGCGLEKLTIPGSLAVIAISAFSGSNHLSEVILQEGVRTINDFAFAKCKHLQTVTIPSTVKSIGKAFQNSVSLSDLYIKAIIPPSLYLYSPTYDVDRWLGADDVNIWVPRSSVDAYKAAKGWSKCKDNIKGYDF